MHFNEIMAPTFTLLGGRIQFCHYLLILLSLQTCMVFFWLSETKVETLIMYLVALWHKITMNGAFKLKNWPESIIKISQKWSINLCATYNRFVWETKSIMKMLTGYSFKSVTRGSPELWWRRLQTGTHFIFKGKISPIYIQLVAWKSLYFVSV